MRITAVELENIKSYRQARIDLTPGLNAICGLNGAGKTTILEAIGFALFDFLPYSQQTFVREGERSGSVRVRLLAADGLEYEVVRRVGGGNPYFVVHVETGTRLAERGPNVLEWIRGNALGIDGEVDLRALFENAVGVPQGLITADFLISPTTRKSVFDPLLRVEEYRQAFEYLLGTANYVRDLTATLNVEIGRLQTDVARLPDTEERARHLEDQLHGCEADLAKLAGELAAVDDELAVLKGIQETIDGLQRERDGARYDIQRHTEMLRSCEAQLAESRAAADIVAAAEPGYRQHADVKDRLRVLDQRRQDRDSHFAARNRAEAELGKTVGTIEHLRGELEAAIKDAERAAALTPMVIRQRELVSQRAELQGADRELISLDRQLDRQRRRTRELEAAIGEAERKLAEARSAEEEAGQLGDVQEQLGALEAELGALDPIKQQLKETKLEGERLRHRHDKLAADVARHAELVGTLETRGRDAGSLATLSERRQELRDERVRVAANIEYQNVARQALDDRHCPLLELACPVVSADASVLTQFDSRAVALADRGREIEAQLEQLEPLIAAAEAAQADVERLGLQAAGLARSAEELPEAREQLAQCRSRYGELAARLEGEGDVRERQRALRAREASLLGASRRAGSAGVLGERVQRDQAQLEEARREVTATEGQRAEVAGRAERLQTVEQELRELGDPTGEQQGLLATAARRSELEAKIAGLEAEATKQRELVDRETRELLPFATLDEELSDLQRLETQYAADHDRYVQHLDAASRLDERQQAVDATTAARDGAIALEAEVAGKLAEVSQSYDRERHARLDERHREVHAAISAKDKELELVRKDADRAAEELTFLRREEDKLRATEAEGEELAAVGRAVGFIRDTIKAAGPTVTETLLANISQTANDIYAEIMDDHAAELRWDRDYEIIVQRGPEERKFQQLSGGEQMSAALAVRLALLKEMSEIDFAFFDEPTQNMDSDRRANLADQIGQVRGFEQLIVISHDDTFEHHTDNLIRLVKQDEETQLAS